MFDWQPAKWVQFAVVGAGLPFVAASVLSTGSLTSDISSRAVAAAGGDWAKVQVDGRDVTLTGTAPSKDASDAALKAVALTYGVRLLNTDGLKVADAAAAPAAAVAATPAPEPVAAPTIVAVTNDNNTPTVTGTWAEGKAKTLDVMVNDKVYSLGKDPELTSDKGNWTLKLAAGALAAGTYAITAKAGDGDKMATSVDKATPLVVAPPAPEPSVAPTVGAANVESGVATVTGTWPEGKSKTLDVMVNDKDYSLGKDPELTSSNGNWVLKLAAPLAAGSYVISAAIGDGATKVMSAVSAAPQLVVAAPPPPPPPVVPLVAPTLDVVTVEAGKPVMLTGTWPAGVASGLIVTLNEKTVQLGKDFSLLTDSAGKWTLKPAADLPPGHYDVVVTDMGADGKTLDAKGSFDIAAPAPPPPPVVPLVAPTLDSVKVEAGKPVVLTGTWPAGVASGLVVALNEKTVQLGKDFSLLTDSAGKWTLKPAADLPPGHYDVVVTDMGADGKTLDAKGSFDIAAPAPPPPPLVAPTLDAVKVEAGKPVVLTGTWPAGVASGLVVTLNEKTVQLGKDFSLLTDSAGKWTLKPAADLPPGHYDVVVTDMGADGKTLDAKGSFDIAAPAPPPPPKKADPPVAPTANAVISKVDHPTVTGTWPEGKGNQLQVELDGITHTLGKDADLTSDGSGNWSLTPAKPLVNGPFDLMAKVTSADGQASQSFDKGDVTVLVPPPAPPPAPAVAYDCKAALAQTAANTPVRFEFNHDDLGPDYVKGLDAYATVLNDARCKDLKVQIAGHADYIGSETFNQGLSERRAATVAKQLETVGVATGNLSSIGYGKSKPLDPAHSDNARAKNRRVEFTAQ